MRYDHEHDTDHVAPDEGCPNCGERHIDQLVWLDDETVGCGRCGTRYQPLANIAAKGGKDAAEA